MPSWHSSGQKCIIIQVRVGAESDFEISRPLVGVGILNRIIRPVRLIKNDKKPLNLSKMGAASRKVDAAPLIFVKPRAQGKFHPSGAHLVNFRDKK